MPLKLVRERRESNAFAQNISRRAAEERRAAEGPSGDEAFRRLRDRINNYCLTEDCRGTAEYDRYPGGASAARRRRHRVSGCK